MSIRVVLVEDDSDYCEALAALLRESSDFTLAGTFPNAEAALARFPSPPPDICLVDIRLPGLSGIELVRALRARHAEFIAVMLTIFEDTQLLFSALRAGAQGYVLKSTPPGQLLELIRDARDGGAPMSRAIARKVLQYFRSLPAEQRAAPRPLGRPAEASALESLTPRESEILTELATGASCKQIADRLQVKAATVRVHLSGVYRKLQVGSATGAVAKYFARDASR